MPAMRQEGKRYEVDADWLWRRCYKKFLKEEWERNQMTIFDFIEDPGEVKIHE